MFEQAGIPWFRELFNYYAGGTNEAGCGPILRCSGTCDRCRQLTDPTGLAGSRRQLVGKEFPIEAKVFFFELGENPRGRFLRISESGAG